MHGPWTGSWYDWAELGLVIVLLIMGIRYYVGWWREQTNMND
jgi:hypothetical protein